MKKLQILNINDFLALDPLEQFEVNSLFLNQNSEEEPSLLTWGHQCPYDVFTPFANTFLSILYSLEICYYNLNYYILWLLHYTTASTILIVFFLILIVLYNNQVIENKNNMIVKTSNSFSLDNFKLFTLTGQILIFFFGATSSVVKTILKANTTLQRKEYFSILYFLFLFITLCNVGGLIPYTFTLTSSGVVTFFFAATHFIGINIIAIYKNGWNFFNLFLPSGVPTIISPFLVIIELISYIAKVFSLSIRLFANMMAGHALLKILIGFSWAMLANGGLIFYGPAILPWVVVTAIIFLEILIAFLQSYVFTVLIAIYINDVFSTH
jgi:F-type H+-transporting ATPase subunit a